MKAYSVTRLKLLLRSEACNKDLRKRLKKGKMIFEL